MTTPCPHCEDLGMIVVTDDHGRRFARECSCRVARRVDRALSQARIPRRYEHASLQSLEDDGKSISLGKAIDTARRFAEMFPVGTNGQGLLMTGTPGQGKTHLAIAILRSAISERGASGQFWEHKELLEKVRSFYDLRSAGAENNLLRSVITCDLLVLDDLGELIPSDWAWDTTSYILNARYNENRSTIITTNRENKSAFVSRPGEETSALASIRLAQRRETLGDKIGDRMLSRLQEMCVLVHLEGPDRRDRENRARFR